jgi:hypothetical protein
MGKALIAGLVGVLAVIVSFALWRATTSLRADARTARGGPEPSPVGSGPKGPEPTTGSDAGPLRGASTLATSAIPSLPGPSPTAPAHPPAPSRPASAADPDEARLMGRLRSIKDQDPAATVTLAREGNRRFPDSPDAPERTSILVHALAADEKRSEARGEAEQMVNHFPDSPWVREVEVFSGAHRHRNIRVSDAGLIEYQ